MLENDSEVETAECPLHLSIPKIYDELQTTPQKSIEKIQSSPKTPVELFPGLAPKRLSYCAPKRGRAIFTPKTKEYITKVKTLQNKVLRLKNKVGNLKDLLQNIKKKSIKAVAILY